MKWVALYLPIASLLLASVAIEDASARSRRSQGYENRSQHYDGRRQERREARSERRSERSRDHYRSSRPDRANSYGTARETSRASRLERRRDDSSSSGWTQTARERLRERQESGRAARLERRGDDSSRSGWTQTARERVRERQESGRAPRVETRGTRSTRQPEVYIDSRYVPRQSYGSATAPPPVSRTAPRTTVPAARYTPPQARSRSSVCGNYSGSQRTSCLNAEVERGRRELAEIERRNRNLDRDIALVCIARHGTRIPAGFVGSAALTGVTIVGDRMLNNSHPCLRQLLRKR